MPSSSAYNQGQVDFASELSKKTGADFYIIFGWELAEGGPPDNPLNSPPGSHYGTPVQAADYDAKILETSSIYKDILQSFQGKYSNEDAAITAQSKAIAYNEHWNVIDPKTHSQAEIADARKQYLSNIAGGALRSINDGVQPNATITQLPGGGQKIVNPGELSPGGPIGGIASALDSVSSIGDIFKWVGGNWQRIFFVLGGVILVVIALVFVAMTVKKNTFSFAKEGES
jgi:hypothetical protein